MRVRVLYFGVLKDVTGRELEELELADGSTVEELLRILEGTVASPGMAVWRSLAVAVNREYAPAAVVLREGDEVALLPPVSGGGHAG